MRKVISVLSFMGILMLLVPFGCKRTIQYSELPVSAADRLRPTNYPGVFIAGVNDVKLTNQPPELSLACPKACATKTVYWVQVTYPVTVCYPPDIIIGGVLTQGRYAPDSIASIISTEGTVKEMVSSRTINGFNPLWCKTKYGPWIAELTDTESCTSCGEGSHTWVMEILGSQGNLTWMWNGTINNRPPEVQFIGQPWVRSAVQTDCRPWDKTECQ